MCGRYNILPDLQTWLAILGPLRDLFEDEDWQARYNVTPSQWVPIIRASDDLDAVVIDQARWGFVPRWVRDENPKARPTIARDDSVKSKPYFRDAFQKRRCLLPMSGFFEWQLVGKVKQPYNVVMQDQQPFLVAGIWDIWNGDMTVALITTEANDVVAPINDRMPVIVPPEAARDWILGAAPEYYLRAYPAELMRAYPVSRDVNKPQNDYPELLQPLRTN